MKIGRCPNPRTRGDILKKSTDFHVRISNDELELIDEKAHRLRMTRSKYVIQAALHQKIIVLDSTSIKQLTSELQQNRYQYKSDCDIVAIWAN